MSDRVNARDAYAEPATGLLYSPFNISIDHVQHVAGASIADDPDYMAIELYTMNHPDRGAGAVVLMVRHDVTLDVYSQPGLVFEPQMFEGRGQLGEWIETEIDYRLQLTPDGLDAYAWFVDKTGAQSGMGIKESSGGKSPINYLSPSGLGVPAPRWFPFTYMAEYNYVPQPGSDIWIQIAGEAREPVKIPIPLPMPGSKFYLAYYSPAPIYGRWNVEYDGALAALQPGGAGQFHVDDTVYELEDNEGHYEIRQIYGMDPQHWIYLTFSPAVPDLLALRNGFSLSGTFSAGADDEPSVLSGEYHVRREGGCVSVDLVPTSKWQPKLDLLMRVAMKFFPSEYWSWPTTYAWSADVYVDDPAQVTTTSRWARTG